jgi:hypothetical protein
MAGSDSTGLKQALIRELQEARVDLLAHGSIAKEQLHPAALVSRSVAQHKVAWAIGSALAGLAIVRVLFPPKIRSDKTRPPDRTGLLSGVLGSLVQTLAKRAATQLATSYFKESAQGYLTSLFQRSGPS